MHDCLPPSIDNVKLYDCTECKKQFISKHSLARHECDKGEEFKCKLCEIEFKSKVGYVQHYQAKHQSLPPNIDENSLFHCEKCGKIFQAERSLKKHSCEVGKIYKCEICAIGK